MSIAFIDLAAQKRVLGDRITAAMERVLGHCGFINGPEVRAFEEQLATFSGAQHAIGCANGTDALMLVLMAENIGPGDAVFVPSFTFVATAEVVPFLGATPVFVDVQEETFNMDPQSLEAAVQTALHKGLKPRAVIPVDLFGLSADYDALVPVARQYGLTVIADSAQGFGCSYHGRRSGTLGDYTTTSFFPAKPLGCYGDGGAILTDDADKAALIRSLAVHGTGKDRYDNVRIGVNSRLDTLQAAILSEKLAIFEEEIAARNRIADRYAQGLAGVVKTPDVPQGLVSVWAQYTVRVKHRNAFAENMKQLGVPTAIYYATPLHEQTGYRGFPVPEAGLPVSNVLAQDVISLPMHPYLDEQTQDRIIEAVKASCMDAV